MRLQGRWANTFGHIVYIYLYLYGYFLISTDVLEQLCSPSAGEDLYLMVVFSVYRWCSVFFMFHSRWWKTGSLSSDDVLVSRWCFTSSNEVLNLIPMLGFFFMFSNSWWVSLLCPVDVLHLLLTFSIPLLCYISLSLGPLPPKASFFLFTN